MFGLLLTQQPLVRVFYLEPGVILFGLLLMCLSVSVVLVFLLKKLPELIDLFLASMLILFLILFSILTFDFVGTVNHVYTLESSQMLSLLFSTHRWLLMLIPVFLSIVAFVLGVVCRHQLLERHTRPYVRVMQISVCVSFVTILFIGLESLI